MLWAFIMEGIETKEMMATFARKGKGRLLYRSSASEPTPEEMKKAIDQLKDIPRFLPFFMFVVVPAPGVTEGYVLLAMSVEKWLGQKFSLLPSHFRSIFQKEEANSDPLKTSAK
jgi:hypothetical protein